MRKVGIILGIISYLLPISLMIGFNYNNLFKTPELMLTTTGMFVVIASVIGLCYKLGAFKLGSFKVLMVTGVMLAISLVINEAILFMFIMSCGMFLDDIIFKKMRGKKNESKNNL